MKELFIQKELRSNGLFATIDKLNLHHKIQDNLVLLKYKQIEADWTHPATSECRGIILDMNDNYKVVAYSYDKFWNIGEKYCATIDWDNAKVYFKDDGSLLNVYYYNNKWNVQTSGIIDASGETYNGKTFKDLFYEAVDIIYGSFEEFESKLNVNYNYMFELCTPYNIVVVPHTEYSLNLHGVRDMTTFEYVDIDNIDLIKVKKFDINSIEEMDELIKTMPWTEEGFVVFDGVNRAKLKNPKYVTMHHTATKSSPYAIIDVIKNNEISEFLTYFKHHTEELTELKSRWDNVISYIDNYYNKVKDIEDTKEFALTIKDFDRRYKGILFNLRNGRIKNVHEGLCNFSNKDLYNDILKARNINTNRQFNAKK